MNKKNAVFDIVVQKEREKIWNYHSFVVSLQANNKMMKKEKESKPYPIIDEEDGCSLSAQEPICNAACDYDEFVIPDEVAYARIVDGVLQITPDIEEEVAEVERGETVSMTEFKTMFAKWL